MKNTQKGASFFLAIVVVALVVWGFWSLKNSKTLKEGGVTLNTQGLSLTNQAANYAPTPISTYEQALMQFANARLQLDESCTATPSKMTFKNNGLLMIDNRSSVSRLIHLGTAEFIINPFDYKIVQVANNALPAVEYVGCGQNLNVATILIQS